MTDTARESVLQQVRQALRRSEPLPTPPVPPTIDEPITRLVHMAIGLADLFARRAPENQMQVQLLYVEDLIEQIAEFLRQQACHTIALPTSHFFDQLGLGPALQATGFEVHRVSDLTPDGMYAIDCAITDVYCAVAEVGGLVFRTTPERPRSLSLIPPVHIVILKPADFLPDLVDLFEKIAQDDAAGETVLITGPAQTAAIAANPVLGVSGPRVLRAFVLR
ncbi:MAG TPA: LUD domain-containing protein [Tepidisphaeraceae bacterium]|nr:LUD domain-containing protein [Tepidisphaeraceae bacterium]